MKKTDAHVHIYERIQGYGARGELRPIGNGTARWANGDLHQLIPREIGGCGFSPEQLLGLMDTNGIEKAVILQGNLYGFQNEYIMEAVRKYPDRLAGACAVDPFARKAPDILSHLLESKMFAAVKFELSETTGLMGFHETFEIDNERMNQLYRIICGYRATLVLDVGKKGQCSYQLDRIRNIALEYPELKIVVCHLFAHGPGEDCLLEEELKQFKLENIWFDLAALPWNTKPELYPYSSALRYVQTAVNVLGADRILWGSDAPGVILEDSYQQLYSYIEESGCFTEKEMEQIFCGNAQSVYSL